MKDECTVIGFRNMRGTAGIQLDREDSRCATEIESEEVG